MPPSPALPILAKRAEIIALLRKNQVLIVAGETGSGKSTQLPLFCREAFPDARVGITQPRRIAATSLARRVAEQSRTALGDFVGYRIRFAEKAGPQTPIVFMTDGIILREIHSDRNLRKYNIIIVDEAHERTLNIDFLLGYLRELLPRRPDLRVVISSATIDTKLFSEAFGNAPIVEVSGRLYPVETLYMPAGDDPDDQTGYVEAAVDAAVQLAEDPEPGDVLVFMPTESDIQESVEKLRGRLQRHCTVLPLFGRLSISDQNRIFRPCEQRKIVVATNVAETSITVPGVRSVVDTGLARIHRYVPSLQTSRLPVERVSQASADQRKGRCGRVSDGLCIRLYSEEDYLGRAPFTPPEIKRSNLAGVILSMTALGLGDIEKFPFLERPSPQAIKDGFLQLVHLGAMDTNHRLTSVGKTMARLPLDPHVSRMILQAQREGVTHRVMIIASGLSVVDPRQRPDERLEKAREKHRLFADPRSDFLTYLNLWNTFHAQWEHLRTQSAMRRFCREHFLSYNRMREWHDMYEQILRGFREIRPDKHPGGDQYERVHRCILAGLIGTIAMKTDEGPYRASRDRELWIFPGSVLARAKPDWIVCHEVVETSRPFARTVAAVQPSWIEHLVPHLCKRRYDSARFDPQSGTVRASETVTVFGLPIVENRRIAYSRVAPAQAAEIFIREGLVEQQLRTHHRFYQHNREVREKVDKTEAKLRMRGLSAGDETVFEFYRKHLAEQVSSVHDLNRLIRARKSDKFLFMTENDVLADELPEEAQSYPDHLTIGEKNFALRYAFEAGAGHDGITVEIPAGTAPYLDSETFGWLVPPMWPEKIRCLLGNLPKPLRRHFVPLAEHAKRLSSAMKPEHRPFTAVLCDRIRELYQIEIELSLLDETRLPEHLRMRYVLVDKKGKEIDATRDLSDLQSGPAKEPDKDSAFWNTKFREYERRGLTSWEIDDLPDRVALTDPGKGVPLYGYPALAARDSHVDLILERTEEDARMTHKGGVRKLLELSLAEDLAWVDKDLKLSRDTKLSLTSLGSPDKIRKNLLQAILGYALEVPTPLPRSGDEFGGLLQSRSATLKGMGNRALEILSQSLDLFRQCRQLVDKLHLKRQGTPFAALKKELLSDLATYTDLLIAPDTRFALFESLPRYLRAFLPRIEKAFLDTASYRKRVEAIEAFRIRLAKVSAGVGQSDLQSKAMEELEEMLEEYAISLFGGQQVRTRYPVSEKRLEKRFEETTSPLHPSPQQERGR